MAEVDMSAHQQNLDSLKDSASESAILNAGILWPDAMLDIAERVSPDDFVNYNNRLLYEAMLSLHNANKPIDPATLLRETRRFGGSRARDLEELIRIFGQPTAITNRGSVESVIADLKAWSVRRKAYRAALDVLSDCMSQDSKESAGEFLERQEQRFLDIANSYAGGEEACALNDAIGDIVKERASCPRDFIGIRGGFPEMDKVLSGFHPGRMYVVGARSKVGKSTLLMNWAAFMISEGHSVLYINTEQSTEEIAMRLIARESQVFEMKIANGTFAKNERDREAVAGAIERLKKAAKFYHMFSPQFSIEKLRFLAKRFVLQQKVEAIFFDYIKMPDGADLRSAQEYQHLGYLASGLKEIAGLLRVPVITAVQLNRAGINTEENDESQIAGSDRILHYCDVMLFLRRMTEKEMSNCGPAAANQILKIGASRYGGDYTGHLYFHGPTLRITEVVGVGARDHEKPG